MQQQTIDRRKLFGPPRAYWSKTLDNFQELTPDLVAAVDVISGFPHFDDGLVPKHRTMVLAGPTGTGKTHCLAALANEDHADGAQELIFRRCKDLMSAFRLAKIDEAAELMRRYGDGEKIVDDEFDNGCRTLLLDDVGDEVDEFAAATLAEILERRNGNELYTVISTNLSRKALQEFLGDRGYSRLMFRCAWVPMPGADYRLRTSA